MKINNPQQLVGKEVCDVEGKKVGTVDKFWNSWDNEHPGYFFGVRPTENTSDTWFRGTHKLFPIYSDYIKDCMDCVTLNKTIEQIGKFWNRVVPMGSSTTPTDSLIDKPIYDKNFSRVGTFFVWVESDGTFKNYGCFVDPYLCETWKVPQNTLMPVPPNFFNYAKDTITLDRSLDELKEFWKQYQKF